ncbi:hypothetical protein CDD81_7764 [Ophiocordyceps australis]|uniref:PH domain-containing protein n=1 Tax=Ophiocordyceps australis TaxID=1399860 RepID=A0A2C5Y3B5_9HYPO|nr:hypothetical protein CDD81_7764 [Ophiocordyceps australis]
MASESANPGPAAVPAAAAPPAAIPPPPPEPRTTSASVSRYRALRGKSVSSLRPFDIFRDTSSSDEASSQNSAKSKSKSESKTNSTASTASSFYSLRRRSKTVAHIRHATTGEAAPVPTSAVLSPKPINAALKPGLNALESLRSPIESVRETLLKAASSANRRTASRDLKPSSQIAEEQAPGDVAPAPVQQDKANDKVPQEDQAEVRPKDDAEHKQSQAARLADEVARLEAETDRILAEQKKLDLARVQAQLVAPQKPKRLLLDKFTFLARGRRSSAKDCNGSHPGTPSSLAPSVFSPLLATPNSRFSRDSSVDASLLLPPASMSFIEPGGKGIVPQIDAPASAINGGDRHVTLRCFSSTITLPITADTSCLDLARAAAEVAKQKFNPETCIMTESYVMVGLERRLRRYERIRDVLNSWDSDEQNSLLLMPRDPSMKDHELDLKSAPQTDDAPPGFCIQLYQSARPGKWSKRWVTLLDNGQIFASKKPDAGPSDKDSTVLCHLSDFDIYSPKESDIRRKLKPPKKFCYAIKSQQKTFLFPNGDNFVHFFCTDDDKLASHFYDSVHGWRSWYLVNRIDLAKKDKAPQITYNILTSRQNAASGIKDQDKTSAAAAGEAAPKDEEPLMDVSSFKAPDVATLSLAKRLSKDSSRSRGAHARESIVSTPREAEFSAGGLLGDAYEKRKQDEATNAQANAQPAKAKGPFTEGPSLLNPGTTPTTPNESSETVEPKSWFPSAAEHSARSRSISTMKNRRPMMGDGPAQLRRERQQPQPLLNFNKDYAEIPRHREGPGHGARHGGLKQPLINFATGGPERPMNAPPQRAMSRRGLPPPGGPPPPGVRQRSRPSGGPPPPGASRRFSPDDLSGVPPLPNRSGRRDRSGEPIRGPGPRHGPPEPLVHRAR